MKFVEEGKRVVKEKRNNLTKGEKCFKERTMNRWKDIKEQVADSMGKWWVRKGAQDTWNEIQCDHETEAWSWERSWKSNWTNQEFER